MIDSHCHIHGSEFDLDLPAVLDSARLNGVKAMLTVGTSPEDSASAVELAKRNVDIYCAIGIHPQSADEFATDDVSNLRNLHCAKVLAVGETGFDLHYTPDTIALQRRLFIAHIELTRELGLPLIIHDRDAHQQTMDLLDEFSAWDLGGVMHCFSGDAAMAAQVVERGYYISVPGVVTFKNSAVLREAVKVVPLERLLIETDCPYLAPVPKRGKRNEPAYLPHTLKTLAELLNLTAEELDAITTENFNRLFKTALL